MTPSKYSALIVGGCVSRDAIDPLLGETIELKRYVARQSFLSAGTDASNLITSIDLPSQFQRRMVKADIEGSLFRDIRNNAGVDLVLWDLNVERLGVWQLDGGSYITDSGEFRRTGMYDEITAGASRINFGEDEHFQIWQDRFFQFRKLLEENGLLPKTLLLAPDWALVDENGETSGVLEAIKAGVYNAIYQQYWDFAEANGVHTLRLQDTVADSRHKWGPAPFHYAESVYQDIRIAILNKLS